MQLPKLAMAAAAAAFLLYAQAQSADPTAAEQGAILDRIRAAALGYADHLRDFTCMQHNVRTVDRSGNGHWKPLETQDIEMTYAGRREHYKVLKIDGKPVGTGKRVKSGYFTASGEFGSSFRMIFDPKANAQFEWDHSQASGGKRACTFRYRVPLETTTMVMNADLDRVPMAHRGFVEADCDSGAVARIHIESDPASVNRHERDIALGLKMDVRYGPVTIADREFLLPQEADETSLFYTTQTRIQIRFEQYRKYDSASTVTFGDPK